MSLEIEIISQHPAGQPRPTPLLFVHGAWHAAWCWERFMPYFAGLGYECHALSMRGHGGSGGREGIRWHSAADYLADLEAAAASLPRPPAVIGHSMGGYVTQLYLERNTPPAAALLAPIPTMGARDMLIRYAAQHPEATLRTLGTLDGLELVGTPALAKDSFFSADLPDDELARHAARLQSESLRIIIDAMALRLPRPRPGACPLLVMAAEQDRIITVAEERATAQAWGADLEVLPDIAHDLMLDTGWERAAGRMAAWLAKQGV
ncbi:alpha/beta fold hydrolase [Oscillochloris sp. ZM17-4]|uniref:alpha/beta hydrolase n=1 Tax=Oscillochloris sp. ZM17-4 TaxID=2866714 RepID=UPI001C72C5D6|nr:alpha/beta fold hydrolase [Oscillochloris sp. ZM17-4]MBX0330238.1 alpha/beta fold hydrolase [Oscillochloris sp. ZM17-4]